MTTKKLVSQAVNYLKDMPSEDHWAILEFCTYGTDHGYPENGVSQEPYVKYTAYFDEKEWSDTLKGMTLSSDRYSPKFVGIFVKVAKGRHDITFNV